MGRRNGCEHGSRDPAPARSRPRARKLGAARDPVLYADVPPLERSEVAISDNSSLPELVNVHVILKEDNRYYLVTATAVYEHQPYGVTQAQDRVTWFRRRGAMAWSVLCRSQMLLLIAIYSWMDVVGLEWKINTTPVALPASIDGCQVLMT